MGVSSEDECFRKIMFLGSVGLVFWKVRAECRFEDMVGEANREKGMSKLYFSKKFMKIFS